MWGPHRHLPIFPNRAGASQASPCLIFLCGRQMLATPVHFVFICRFKATPDRFFHCCTGASQASSCLTCNRSRASHASPCLIFLCSRQMAVTPVHFIFIGRFKDTPDHFVFIVVRGPCSYLPVLLMIVQGA